MRSLSCLILLIVIFVPSGCKSGSSSDNQGSALKESSSSEKFSLSIYDDDSFVSGIFSPEIIKTFDTPSDDSFAQDASSFDSILDQSDFSSQSENGSLSLEGNGVNNHP